MKRILLMTGSAVAIMLGGCVLVIDDAEAAYGLDNPSRYAGTTLNLNLDEDEDVRVSGTDVEVSGRVGGELRVRSADFVARDLSVGSLDASAADITFYGDIQGRAEINAADFILNGNMGGELIANTADLEITGIVDGPIQANMADGSFSGSFAEVRANAADITFGSDSEVEMLYVNAADLMMNGRIYGDLDASVRHAEINGDVEGLSMIWADPGRGRISRTDGLVLLNGNFGDVEICAKRVVVSGQINGTLVVRADEEPEFTDNGSAGQVEFTPRNNERCERS